MIRFGWFRFGLLDFHSFNWNYIHFGRFSHSYSKFRPLWTYLGLFRINSTFLYSLMDFFCSILDFFHSFQNFCFRLFLNLTYLSHDFHSKFGKKYRISTKMVQFSTVRARKCFKWLVTTTKVRRSVHENFIKI